MFFSRFVENFTSGDVADSCVQASSQSQHISIPMYTIIAVAVTQFFYFKVIAFF
jgi:hypothetical protein